MANRKTTRNTPREEPQSRGGKGGGMLAGLFIGLLIGLVAAAALAWYFNYHTATFKTVDEAPAKPKTTLRDSELAARSEDTATSPGITQPRQAAEPTPPPAPSPATREQPATKSKPRVDYTFYGILPGDKPAKQALPTLSPPESKEIWWLQVAALKNPHDADQLKAKLSLLGLQVVMQKIENNGTILYRIRTGPYKLEDDALGDLDTLATNDFEPRLFKEPRPTTSPQ